MCVGRCKRLFYCLCGGGGTRAPSSSSPLRTIGPAQSAEGECPGEGGGAKGRSLSASLREACLCFEASKRERNCERKRVQFGETVALEACSCFEASERWRDSVLNLPGETLNLRAPSLHFWQ